MGKRSRSSSSSSSSDSSEEEKDKKKSKKEKKKDKEKKKKKKDKKKKKEKKKDKKKGKEQEVPKVPLVLPRAGSAAEERERLLRISAVPVAVPGNTPEVNDAGRFQQAKARLDALRSAHQKPEKSVPYSVRKPNW
ncbi:unnamed protein product [Symbiodinium natans]|uniref:Uncharacterized protein n=1 Tax=Symbiodinium natans TaxID=878477 RepID=A0A812RL32_9DINO|nr:unnamed protein product [Symbiodinium natans]